MPYVFLSHASDDRRYAERLADRMREQRIETWMYGGLAGTEWYDEVEQRLDGSAVVALLMSTSARSSDWVIREMLRAQRRGVPVVPILLEGEPWLAAENLNYADVRDGALPDDSFFDRLRVQLASDEPGETLAAAHDVITAMDDEPRRAIPSLVEVLREEIPRLRGGSRDGLALNAWNTHRTLHVTRVGYLRRYRMNLMTWTSDAADLDEALVRLGWRDESLTADEREQVLEHLEDSSSADSSPVFLPRFEYPPAMFGAPMEDVIRVVGATWMDVLEEEMSYANVRLVRDGWGQGGEPEVIRPLWEERLFSRTSARS